MKAAMLSHVDNNNDRSWGKGVIHEDELINQFLGHGPREDVQETVFDLIRQGELYSPRPDLLRRTVPSQRHPQ